MKVLCISSQRERLCVRSKSDSSFPSFWWCFFCSSWLKSMSTETWFFSPSYYIRVTLLVSVLWLNQWVSLLSPRQSSLLCHHSKQLHLSRLGGQKRFTFWYSSSLLEGQLLHHFNCLSSFCESRTSSHLFFFVALPCITPSSLLSGNKPMA
jgi:hypothetical protein